MFQDSDRHWGRLGSGDGNGWKLDVQIEVRKKLDMEFADVQRDLEVEFAAEEVPERPGDGMKFVREEATWFLANEVDSLVWISQRFDDWQSFDV